jgi:hypothetical protein
MDGLEKRHLSGRRGTIRGNGVARGCQSPLDDGLMSVEGYDADISQKMARQIYLHTWSTQAWRREYYQDTHRSILPVNSFSTPASHVLFVVLICKGQQPFLCLKLPTTASRKHLGFSSQSTTYMAIGSTAHTRFLVCLYKPPFLPSFS